MTPLLPGDWIDLGHGPLAVMQVEAQQDRDGWSVSVQCAWTIIHDDAAPVKKARALKLGDVMEVGGIEFILRFIKHQFRMDEIGRRQRSANLWGCDTLLAQIKDDERERQSKRVRQIDRHLQHEEDES